jgi:CheY-like chemotaxis protein
MPMKLLIIHDIKTVTRLVQFIRTEYSDADVDWFSSALDAAMILQNNKYDAVLCGLDMANMNGIAFKKNLDASINRGVPYIVLTPSGGADRRQELAGHGIEHILALPCAALELRNMIDCVTDSRSKRIHTRYSIPDTTAAIRFGDREVRAEVVNISIDGILCELDCPRPSPDIMMTALMSVRFPTEYGKDILKDIAVSLLRLAVRSWRADRSPDRVSIVFRFHDMPGSYLAAMEAAFAKAGQDLS